MVPVAPPPLFPFGVDVEPPVLGDDGFAGVAGAAGVVVAFGVADLVAAPPLLLPPVLVPPRWWTLKGTAAARSVAVRPASSHSGVPPAVGSTRLTPNG